MPNKCAMYGCASSYTKKSNITFQRFPKNDEEMRYIWILCSPTYGLLTLTTQSPAVVCLPLQPILKPDMNR